VIREPKSDVLIIGAGIVGLSVGIALLQARPRLKILVIDKEVGPGQHASGRNSGVLHAGFYYSPNSLKAKFCREGNAELRKLCIENEIPVLESGKVVVARNAEEDARLDLLYSRGITNGVELEIHDAANLEKHEPLARTHGRYLWSPKTAISDPKAVATAMVKKFESLGGRVSYSSKVQVTESSGEVSVKGFEAKYVINSAGAQSDRLARGLGMAKEYAMVPFMGIYRSVEAKKLPLRRLVYPADIGQALIAATALVRGKAHSLGEILKSELPKLRESSLVLESATLVPSAGQIKAWTKRPPGIRSQLVNIKSGKLEQDFIVQNFHNSTHILNAVSPGWTSAIPFGRWVANEYVLYQI